MTHNHRSDDVRVHQEISELIPWYLNGSIGDHERQRVEAHLLLCVLCRDDLARERRVYQGMTADTAVEYMPAASLRRLQARLDGVDAAASADMAADTPAVTHAPNEVIRAVFSPAITLVELQSILDEAQLRIISGPTEAGVYSLAANSRRPVSSSLALLRAHAKVRFAESTQPTVGSGDTP